MECWLATLKASSATMSHDLEQVKAARITVIYKSASMAAHFLLARVQLSTCYPLSLSWSFTIHLTASLIQLTASLYLCPADCFQDILFQQAGTFLWHNLELTSQPPARMTVTHLMSTLPNTPEVREIESDCFEFFQSQFRNPPISPSEFLLCTVFWSKKKDTGMLTSNSSSSSLTLSHTLQVVKAAPIRVICKSASIAPHFLLARLQWYSFQFVFQLVFPA